MKNEDKQKLPTVAVCVPSFDHVHTGFAFSLAAMCTSPFARLILINHRSSLIHKGRDSLIVEALKHKPDYILFLDSDMKFPPFTLGRLLSHGVDIVGAAYVRRTAPHELLVKTLPGHDQEVVTSGLHEVALLPTGCMLIKASVFDSFTRPYFRSPAIEANGTIPAYLKDYIAPELLPATIGEDTEFCARLREEGFKLWLDVDLTHDMGHIGEHVFMPVAHDSVEEAVAAPANLGNEVNHE